MRMWSHSSSKADRRLSTATLIPLVQQLGTEKFVDSLQETFADMTGATRASVFVYSRSCTPRLLKLTGGSPKEIAHYRDTFFKFDKAVALRQAESDAETKHVLLFATDEILQKEYRAAYVEAGLSQRLSVLGGLGDEGWVSVHFYRSRASGAFTESQIEAVNEAVNLLTVLADKHAQFVDQRTPGHSLQDYRDRLGGLAPGMTARELDVCSLIAKGFTVPEISAELGIEASTVICYRRRGYARLGVANAKELLSSCF